MTNTQDLLELAERCEKAEWADRELDLAIAKVVGRERWYAGGNPKWHFTTSLDAAMTLIDVETFFHISRFSPGNGPCEAHVYPNRCLGDDYTGTGATPALALTAAALRAKNEESDRG